jgi:hypothetical protein
MWDGTPHSRRGSPLLGSGVQHSFGRFDLFGLPDDLDVEPVVGDDRQQRL